MNFFLLPFSPVNYLYILIPIKIFHPLRVRARLSIGFIREGGRILKWSGEERWEKEREREGENQPKRNFKH